MQRTLSLTQSTRQAQRLAFTTNCLTNCGSEYDLRTGAGDRSAVSALIWSTDTGPLLLPDRCLCSYRNGSLPYSQSSYTFPPTPSLSLSLSVTDTHTETSHDQSYLLGKTLLRRGGGGLCVWGGVGEGGSAAIKDRTRISLFFLFFLSECLVGPMPVCPKGRATRRPCHSRMVLCFGQGTVHFPTRYPI